MAKELTKVEVEHRARELAQRVMAKPPQPRIKPKAAAKVVADDDAKPGKREPAASAS
ncbi:MAG TPA: hypothetical protein VMU82_05410 [Acetobacteraceae bacterium]|nr:hypothetical protein [Acetobacteraceae bacterium]